VQFRFNRRHDLRAMLGSLLRALAATPRQPERGIGVAEVHRQSGAHMSLGAWQVNQSDDEYLVVYLAQVDAAADGITLQEAIEVVMYSADCFEKQLSAQDTF
jgi:hypothetical protein